MSGSLADRPRCGWISGGRWCRAKQSFKDKRVPKREFGNEEIKGIHHRFEEEVSELKGKATKLRQQVIAAYYF